MLEVVVANLISPHVHLLQKKIEQSLSDDVPGCTCLPVHGILCGNKNEVSWQIN